jgi:hypothetical protein
MMKKLITIKLLPVMLSLASTSALAHPGHMPDETVHGLLHVEHIITLAAAGAIVYLVYRFLNR